MKTIVIAIILITGYLVGGVTIIEPINPALKLEQTARRTSSTREQLCTNSEEPKSCRPEIDMIPVPIICPEDNSIPLPNSTKSCNPSDEIWIASSCYRSKNIANRIQNPNVKINLNDSNLLDGNLNTFTEIGSSNTHLPTILDIWLGRQYSVYAVFVILFSAEDNVAVDVHTRFSNDQNNSPCNPSSSASSRNQKHVFYCTSSDPSKITSGILTQNVFVTVTNPLVRVAEIEIYENLGLECGAPSRPFGTVYTPSRSRYFVGESVEYRCETNNTILFGSNTRRCSSDGKWAGFAPLCYRSFPLERKGFGIESSNNILHDGNESSCVEIEYLGKVNSSAGWVSYDIRLHNRAIISLIEIKFKTELGQKDCHIEMPTHPNIGFVRSNRSGDSVTKNMTLQYVPRIRDNRFTCPSDEGNPAQLIQSLKDEHQGNPELRILCPVGTILCEIRVQQVEDLPNTCGDPESPINSKHERATDNTVTYSCHPGFRLSTNKSRRSCINQRQWEPPPTCDKITCQNYPPAISTFEWRLLNNSIAPGSIAHYVKAISDSDQSPEIIMICDADGRWVDITPRTSFYMITISSVSAGLFVLVVAGFFLLFRRISRNSQNTTESGTRNNFPVHFMKTGSGRPPSSALLTENVDRPDSTDYEEIEQFYKYDDVRNNAVNNGPTKHDVGRHNNSPISPFPRPPPAHFTFPPVVSSTTSVATKKI